MTVVPFVALIVAADERASLSPFWDHFLAPKPPCWRPRGVILVPLGSILVVLGSPGPPEGTLWGQRWIFDGFWVPLVSPWGSVWAHFRYISMIFSIKSGGWVTDPVFRWFRGGKVTSAQWLYVVKT